MEGRGARTGKKKGVAAGRVTLRVSPHILKRTFSLNSSSPQNTIITGATSSAACQFGCAAGFYVKSATTCFKCQQTTSWSPGSNADLTGPTQCSSCTGTGYIGARLMPDGSYKCNETGQYGNTGCIPCKMCATGTIPGGYSCPA
jgi:hypothetical protein